MMKQAMTGDSNSENLMARDMLENTDYQSAHDNSNSTITGSNINGTNISVNELPCKIILLLSEIILCLIKDARFLSERLPDREYAKKMVAD